MDDPHLTHQLARKGAKIIFHAVNGGRGNQESIDLHRAFHESNQCLRAAASQLFIVTVDNAYPLEKENSCSSGVISPDGKHITKLPQQGEGIFFQDIDVSGERMVIRDSPNSQNCLEKCLESEKWECNLKKAKT